MNKAGWSWKKVYGTRFYAMLFVGITGVKHPCYGVVDDFGNLVCVEIQ